MKYLYIGSMKGFSGKSLVTLGLGLLFRERGLRIGYVKPYGKIPLKQGKAIIDADAEFMRKALEIDDAPQTVSPFVLTFEVQSDLLKGAPSDRFAAVEQAIASVRDRDIVIIGGAADLYEGSAFGIDGLKIIRHLGASTLVVEPWSPESSLDAIAGAQSILGEHFAGLVLNKVPQPAHDFVEQMVRPFLEQRGMPVYAALHRDILLDSIPVRQLNEILGGKVICCEDRLDEFIETFSIGAMDVDSAIRYFRRTPNKAVITGAHRADIQLAALETSTKCIILTGGMYTNDVIVGKAKAAGVPIISVSDDTYSTIDRVESVLGKIRIREQKKVLKTKEIIEKEFDLERLMKTLDLG